MGFTHGTPCPYKVENHRVLICIWDVGTRRAESGVLSGGDGFGACGAFDGVHTRHAVSVQSWESSCANLHMGRRDSACRVGGVVGWRWIWRVGSV